MLPVSHELKEKLKKLNLSLKEAFPLDLLDRHSLRQKLEQIGSFTQINKEKVVSHPPLLNGNALVGIDGSVNSTKGTPMRAFSVFQALALSTLGEEEWAADIYTPLLDYEEDDEKEGQAAKEANKRGSLLAALEVKLASEVLDKWEIGLLLLDGSLLHFYIDTQDEWEKARAKALKKDVLTVGVSEEIGTRTLSKLLTPEHPSWSDKDILHGVLRIGEVFEWEEWSPASSRLWRVAFRPSLSPEPICVDGIIEQKEQRLEILQLLYSLTPEQGRGIPFWLDIIDNQVRVTDALVKTMVEQYIDPDLRHRLFSQKRNQRMI